MTDPISPPLPIETLPRPRPMSAQRAAEALEASFLAEMLKFAGFGEQQNTFSGGAGEAQFATFHREALAGQIVRRGGLGLADIIAQSLRESGDAR